VGGEFIVVDLRGKRIYGLNGDGEKTWHRLADPSERKPASREAGEFLDELIRLGLIIETDNPSRVERPAEAWQGRPRVLWREEMQQVAASCSFHPAENPLCNQVPTL